jgi:hypothetical protein
MWYRVFALLGDEVAPAVLLEQLHRAGFAVSGSFRGDDQGWYQVDLAWDGGAVTVNRYLADEPGIRAELNSWAAWVESQESCLQREQLMHRFISSRQVFTMHLDAVQNRDDSVRLCRQLCLFLSQRIDGVFHIDEEGLFDSQGNLLIAET